MPSDDIQEIFIFQNDMYIDTCPLVTPYNEATAEQTEQDYQSYTEQSKYVSKYDKMVKDGKNALAKVAVIPNDRDIQAVSCSPSPIEETTKEEELDFDAESYLASARELAKSSL